MLNNNSSHYLVVHEVKLTHGDGGHGRVIASFQYGGPSDNLPKTCYSYALQRMLEDAVSHSFTDEPDEANGLDMCPGCGCKPGDGVTPGCTHEDGCGYFKAQSITALIDKVQE